MYPYKKQSISSRWADIQSPSTYIKKIASFYECIFYHGANFSASGIASNSFWTHRDYAFAGPAAETASDGSGVLAVYSSLRTKRICPLSSDSEAGEILTPSTMSDDLMFSMAAEVVGDTVCGPRGTPISHLSFAARENVLEVGDE